MSVRKTKSSFIPDLNCSILQYFAATIILANIAMTSSVVIYPHFFFPSIILCHLAFYVMSLVSIVTSAAVRLNFTLQCKMQVHNTGN